MTTLITESGTEHATASGAVWLRHFNASLLLYPAAVPGGPDKDHASKAVMVFASCPALTRLRCGTRTASTLAAGLCAGSAALRLPWCRASGFASREARLFRLFCHPPSSIPASAPKCRPLKGVASGHLHAASGGIFFARAREEESVSAHRADLGLTHPPPFGPRQHPECVVFLHAVDSENKLRMLPPVSGQMPSRQPCRHVAAFWTKARPPPSEERSRSQTFWVCHAQRGVRERVGPTGHHDPHPPGNLACSAPWPLRVHERRPALECPRCIEEIAAVLAPEGHRTAQGEDPPPFNQPADSRQSDSKALPKDSPLLDAHAYSISADPPRGECGGSLRSHLCY